MKTTKEKEYTFKLPEPRPVGCVMRVSKAELNSLIVEVDGSNDFKDQQLGLLVRHHGQVLFCDSLVVTDQTTIKHLPDSLLHVGVNDISIIDTSGRVLCNRMFFKYPSNGYYQKMHSKIDACPLQPRQKVNMLIKSPTPNTSFSISIRDADTQVNEETQNIATWLLLSSDLKGYIHNPYYYLESNDKRHQEDIDILMLVQGWNSFDLEYASGYKSFELKHPVEDGLYLFGQLHKYKKKDELEGVELNINLYNHGDKVLAGSAITEKNGYYIFRIPDCYGTWSMRMKTRLEGKDKKYYIGINRNVSPKAKMLFRQELMPFDLDLPAVEHIGFSDTISDEENEVLSSVLLDSIVVSAKKAKRNYLWEQDEEAEKKSYIHYDCSLEADRIADMGQPMPSLVDWLKSKNNLFEGNDNISGAMPYRKNKYNRMDTGLSYSNKPIVWVVNNRPMFITCMPGKTYDEEELVNEDHDIRSSFPASLDEVKDVYISDINRLSRFVPNGITGTHWVVVMIYTHSQSTMKNKCLRNTFYEGFSHPKKFYSSEYVNLPDEKDFRRTLLWEPNAKTDEFGNVKLTFYNNSNCRIVQISAEGIDNKGNPVMCHANSEFTVVLNDETTK